MRQKDEWKEEEDRSCGLEMGGERREKKESMREEEREEEKAVREEENEEWGTKGRDEERK